MVVAAHRLAEPSVRNQLTELMSRRDLDASDITRWQHLIAATGAVQWIEQLIDQRLSHALERIHTSPLDDTVRTALVNMATVCTQRAA